MSSVLLVLTFKPWEWNQASNESKTCSIVAMSWGRESFLPESRIWVSSAYCTTCAPGAKRDRSLAKIWKRRGPSEEAWKTPIGFGRGLERSRLPRPSAVQTD